MLKWLEIGAVLMAGGIGAWFWATHDEGVPPVDGQWRD